MSDSARRRRSRSPVSEADPRTDTISYVIFLLFELLCILPPLMMLAWVALYAGGLGWDGSHKQFNWHPLCMVLSISTFFSNGVVAYRILPFRRRTRKAMHALIHIMTLIVAVVGLAAVFQNHQTQSIPHLYSLHSWCGLVVICLFGMQWMGGLLSFIFPILSGAKRADFKPWHVRFGMLIFFGAVATCLIGINEKMSFLGKDHHHHLSAEAERHEVVEDAHVHEPLAHYSDLPIPAILCNVTGLVLMFLASVVFCIASKPDYTSGAKMRGFQLVPSG